MGNISYESHPVHLPVPSRETFEFLSKLDNFGQMLPEQVTNWQATSDSCSFDIPGMAHIELATGQNKEFSEVNIISAPGSSAGLSVSLLISPDGESGSEVMVRLTADLSPMLQMMAARPLQNLVNIMADRLKEHF